MSLLGLDTTGKALAHLVLFRIGPPTDNRQDGEGLVLQEAPCLIPPWAGIRSASSRPAAGSSGRPGALSQPVSRAEPCQRSAAYRFAPSDAEILRDGAEVRVNGELPAFAVGAGTPNQPERVHEPLRPAPGTSLGWRSGVDHELLAATRAEVWGIVPDASGQVLVVRVVRVAFRPRLVEVVRVAVRSGLDGLAASTADET